MSGLATHDSPASEAPVGELVSRSTGTTDHAGSRRDATGPNRTGAKGSAHGLGLRCGNRIQEGDWDVASLTSDRRQPGPFCASQR